MSKNFLIGRKVLEGVDIENVTKTFFNRMTAFILKSI